jgi:hypothetical protein
MADRLRALLAACDAYFRLFLVRNEDIWFKSKKKKREDIWLQMLGDANDAIIGMSILDMIHISGDVHLSL